MPRLVAGLFLLVFATALPVAAAIAADEQPFQRPEASKTERDKPEIVIDETTNTISVLIGGREILAIDAKGLHVNGNIDYTGALTDTAGPYDAKK